MKLVGNIVEILTKDLIQVKGECEDCELSVKNCWGKLDCRIPSTMNCPCKEGHCYKKREKQS